MSKVVAIMSMSLDGYVADLNDGVAEVFDWYFTSGDVEFHTGGSDPMTFTVSGPSAEHLRYPVRKARNQLAADSRPLDDEAAAADV